MHRDTYFPRRRVNPWETDNSNRSIQKERQTDWLKYRMKKKSWCVLTRTRSVSNESLKSQSSLMSSLCNISCNKKQEAFRERRHLHVGDLWSWVVTLTQSQGQKRLCHKMSLIVFYFGNRYDVYGYDTLRDITICLVYVTFLLHLWPLSSVKVTCILIIRCILCC